MDNEQTKKTDTPGNKTDPNLSADGKPLSEYDKAIALVKRREDVTKAENEVLERKEKLVVNSMLGGTTGGHVDANLISEEDKKKQEAKEFFKDTQLERDIDKL